MKMRKSGLVAALPLLAVGAMMVPGSACSEDALPGNPMGDLCCSDFAVGADMSAVDWGIEGEGNAKFTAFMQATGDLSAAATATLEDVAGACRAIASDLGAEPTAAEIPNDPAARVKFWCNLAVGQIQANVTAQGSLTVEVQPATCSISASAQANCEAKCTANVECEAELGNVEARCDPGQLSGKCTAECSGTCEGSANLAVACEGTCEGTCDGTCEGTCEGKCDGTESSGSCSGRCEGTCSGGSCQGECRGSCKMDANANVSCSGNCTGGCSVELKAPSCKAELTPPSAECSGSAECNGSCEASASAKAECNPPAINIAFSGSVDAQMEIYLASLKMNLPKIFAVAQARGDLLLENAMAVAEFGGSISAEAPNFSVKATACVIPAVLAISTAVSNISATVEASASITTAVQ